jgi:NTE family protein
MNKNIHLVLGSGGARGVAHIGVIEALEAAGFSIRAVTGSSMGAVVGGMYCAGHLPTYKEWLLTLNKTAVLRLFDLTITRHGFVKGEKVFRRLEKFAGNWNIKDLPIPFTAVATDIHTHSEVCFTEGNLYKAMRASTAIPGIFTPVPDGDTLLIDGAVLNPLPLNLTNPQDGLLVVGVSLSGPAQQLTATNIRKPGLMELMSRAYDCTQEQLLTLLIEKHQPDVLIQVPRNVCGIFDFHKAKDIIDIGRTVCEKVLSQLQIPQSIH